MMDGKDVYVVSFSRYAGTGHAVFCSQSEAEECRAKLVAGEVYSAGHRFVGEVCTVEDVCDEAERIASSLSRVTERWVRESFFLCMILVFICIDIFILSPMEGMSLVVFLAGIALGYGLFVFQKAMIIRSVRKHLPQTHVDDIVGNASRAFSVRGKFNGR
jgi:hypothetical protein